MMMIAIGGGVLLVGIALIVYFAFLRGKGGKSGGANGAAPSPRAPSAACRSMGPMSSI